MIYHGKKYHGITIQGRKKQNYIGHTKVVMDYSTKILTLFNIMNYTHYSICTYS